MHSPFWQASNSAQLVSFWQRVSQLPARHVFSNEQSVLSVHSTHSPFTHSGFPPKQSSSLPHTVGITQREPSHAQRHSPSHSGSVHTGWSGKYAGLAQAQEPPLQVFAVHSASELQAVKLMLHEPLRHLLAKQSTLPLH